VRQNGSETDTGAFELPAGAYQFPDVTVQFSSQNSVAQKRPALFGGENHVDEDFG
jgi:hypothetical protein